MVTKDTMALQVTRTIAVRIGPELLEKMNDLKMILRTDAGRIPSDSEIIRRALEQYAEKYLTDAPLQNRMDL